MNLLAIEMSASTGSAAILRSGSVLARGHWGGGAPLSEALFPELTRVASEAKLSWGEVDWFVAGRGPGKYSGLRMAATAVQSLALPGGNMAGGVNSAEALARDLAVETGHEQVAVIGDARRGYLWWGLLSPGRPFDCTLVKAQALAGLLPERVLIASPDADRLAGTLKSLHGGQRVAIMAVRVPTAEAVGCLAWERLRAGQDLEPATPFYLHPAVAGMQTGTVS